MGEKIDYKDFTIEINYDDDYSMDSPRDWNNVGIMICSHGRYDLGDMPVKSLEGSEDFTSWGDVADAIEKAYKPLLMFPLYMYDHSGLYFSLGEDFYNKGLSQGHAYFDSGQVGFVIVTRESLKEAFGCKNMTKKVKDQIMLRLKYETEVYEKWCNGDVYNVYIEDDTGEYEESCGGFYGYDEAEKAAKDMVDYLAKEKKLDREKKLKTLIKNHVPLDTRQSILQ